MKHYDILIDQLCANQIAVLGLLTYASVVDESWKAGDGQGKISPSYLNTFTRTTTLLVDYYDDRIKAWEIWNEPDYTPTGLAAGEFAKLLLATSAIVHAADDLVVFGRLANVDRLSRDYFRQFYVALRNLGSPATPYDIFALHPYPSYEYKDSQGQLLLDPQAHWRAESPTVLNKFQNIMRGDNAIGRDDSAKELWITEFGWNSAKGSAADREDRCITLEATWVMTSQQAIYVGAGLDLLFKETGWPGENRAAVTKAFLYQYQDTSSPFRSSECTPQPTQYSPSWWTSWFWQLVYGPPPEESVDVPWSFGLYDGTLQKAKEARCTFKHYPNWVNGCYTLQYSVYLPAISDGAAVTAADK